MIEVAIIGAGPAGSTLAALLARRGVSVALVDRDRFPRDKLCGEFLSYDALPLLDALGVDGALEATPSITRCRIVGRSRIHEFAFPRPARGVSRLLLDDLLLRTAIARGAQRLDGWTAASIDATGDRSRLTIQSQGETRTIDAQVIVGAWGRWGRFDTQLQRAFVRDRAHRHFGFKRHYRGSGPGDVIELYSFGRGYLGVSSIENGLTNICGLVHETRLAGHKGRWEAFVEDTRRDEHALEAMYSRYAPVDEHFLSSEPVVFRARSPVERGVLMIGDASGIIDPLAGNGMAMAIQSAFLAAPAILRLLQAGRDRASIEVEYIRNHHDIFAPRIAWSRRAAFLLSRPSLLDLALAAGRSSSLDRFLLDRTRAADEVLQRLSSDAFC